MSTDNRQIEKLQTNLSSLRKIAGWTAEDLGNELDVTKQTISNLETGKTKMSRVQYIAIRAVLDMEAKKNENLSKAMNLVLNDYDSTAKEQEKNEEKVKTVAAATNKGVSADMLGAILGASVASITMSILEWLPELLKKDK